jgi:protein CpxP
MFLRRVSIIMATIISLGGTLAMTEPNLLLSPAVAQSGGANRGPSDALIKELNLSQQQVAQIKKIQTEARAKMIPKIQALRQTQQELNSLLAGTGSKEQIMSKYRQIKQISGEIADADFAHTLAIRDVLTPQQRQKFSGINQSAGQGRPLQPKR